MSLKLNAFSLQLFKPLFELIFNVEVVVPQLLLQVVILEEKVIQLVHFEIQVLLGHLKLSDLFLVAHHLTI